jgi:hypothetical protein
MANVLSDEKKQQAGDGERIPKGRGDFPIVFEAFPWEMLALRDKWPHDLLHLETSQ